MLPSIGNFGNHNHSFSHETIQNTPNVQTKSIIDILKNKKNKAKRRMDRDAKRHRIDESFIS